MVENYLALLEISMQLYINKDENKNNNNDFRTNLDKYIELSNKELKKMSFEDKEILKQIITQKIEVEQTEKTTIVVIFNNIARDESLRKSLPGHVLAQYSDKIKKYPKKMQFLQSVSKQLEMETPSITRK